LKDQQGLFDQRGLAHLPRAGYDLEKAPWLAQASDQRGKRIAFNRHF
jgi:hypothetical protein